MNHLELGASLYVPATHSEMLQIALGEKFPSLKSVIFDTEDSISYEEIPQAYENIMDLLSSLRDLNKQNRPLLFIRVRNPEEFKKVVQMKNIDVADGFVLPKFTVDNMEEYMALDFKNKYIMPVLEKNIFNVANIERIRDFLLGFKDNILSIRIGATDLLNELGMRRDPKITAYDIGYLNKIIADLVSIFKPYGFNITAPVWEDFSIESQNKLREEVFLDLMNGLFGKSVIHPSHIDLVQDCYKVHKCDYESAVKLLSENTPAVFKTNNRMDEKSTHSKWATQILKRAEIYGLKEE
jgi:citrate lyase beta subunit